MEPKYSALFIAPENLQYDEMARLLSDGHDPNAMFPAGWPTFVRQPRGCRLEIVSPEISEDTLTPYSFAHRAGLLQSWARSVSG